jgi:hypothetical protein
MTGLDSPQFGSFSLVSFLTGHDVSILQKIIFRVVRSLQVGCFKIVGAEDDMSSVRRYEKVFHQFVGVK